jgi:hypothetical protein
MVSMRHRRLPAKIIQADAFYFQQLDKVLDKLFQIAVHDKLSWSDLANASGMAYSTIVNLGERITKRPQYRTVLLLAKTVGRTIAIKHTRGKTRVALRLVG